MDPSICEVKHILNSMSGKTTKSAPKKYVEKLYDNYAANFEKSLVKNLKYNTPKIIKEVIIEDNKVNLGSVLDLGCGTGLVGCELKSFLKNIRKTHFPMKLLIKPKENQIFHSHRR